MRILIAGASGLIGQLLINHWQKQHELILLGRNCQKLQAQFPENRHFINWQQLADLDAQQIDIVINLCGENIGATRWTQARKKALIDSRVTTNERLITWIIASNSRPSYYSASAIGIYGLQDLSEQGSFDEASLIDDQHPRDFLSAIGVAWERALQPALDNGIPLTFLRFGVVLSKNGGMLQKLLPVFKMGLGSILGNGQQMISWIGSQDLLSAFDFLLQNRQLTGPINITSPEPVSQKIFAQTLAKVLHRPMLLWTPQWFIKLLFGEMGEKLLLGGQRVLPKRLLENGFHFNYPLLQEALETEFAKYIDVLR